MTRSTKKGQRAPPNRQVGTEYLIHCVYLILAALVGGGSIVLSDVWPAPYL